jgi:hypothetical protein
VSWPSKIHELSMSGCNGKCIAVGELVGEEVLLVGEDVLTVGPTVGELVGELVGQDVLLVGQGVGELR